MDRQSQATVGVCQPEFRGSSSRRFLRCSESPSRNGQGIRRQHSRVVFQPATPTHTTITDIPLRGSRCQNKRSMASRNLPVLWLIRGEQAWSSAFFDTCYEPGACVNYTGVRVASSPLLRTESSLGMLRCRDASTDHAPRSLVACRLCAVKRHFLKDVQVERDARRTIGTFRSLCMSVSPGV